MQIKATLKMFISVLTHWGQDKMDAIWQTTFSSAFSWMKMFEFELKFHWGLFLRDPINNIPALVQIMAWYLRGDKPLSEPMMGSLLMHICVPLPQWVNSLWHSSAIWQHRSGSTLVQIMAWCLMAPGHYLNQCWLLINRVLCNTLNAHDNDNYYVFENHTINTLRPRQDGRHFPDDIFKCIFLNENV